MGVKRVLPAYQIIPNAGIPNRPNSVAVSGTMTGTNVITSNPSNIENWDNIGFQVSWTGNAVGTLAVLCSIDGTNYFALTFSPALTQPAGASGGFLINATQLPYPWVVFQYTNASGTGALKVWICGKDLN